jgi:preprotein translocase subunit SecB
VTVDVKANATSSENLYESILSIHVSATHKDNNVFLIDLVYQGVFEIENLTDDIKEPYLLVECPRILFPFARRIIYDLHADGGLPPLLLDTVNFAELYKKRKDKNEIN